MSDTVHVYHGEGRMTIFWKLLFSAEQPVDLLVDNGLMKKLANCGIQDFLIAIVDGFKGFPEVMTAALPNAITGDPRRSIIAQSANMAAP